MSGIRYTVKTTSDSGRTSNSPDDADWTPAFSNRLYPFCPRAAHCPTDIMTMRLQAI